MDTNGNVLETFSGNNAMEIYKRLAKNNTLSEMSHAFDIGAELQKAEIALTLKIPYIQDRPLDFTDLSK